MNPNVLWLIPGLPLLSFLVIVFGLIVGPGRSANHRISGYVAILGIFGAWLLALWSLIVSAGGTALHAEVPWFSIGEHAELTVGVKLDPLAAMMLVVVTTVSLLVQVYSQGYMADD